MKEAYSPWRSLEKKYLTEVLSLNGFLGGSEVGLCPPRSQ